MRARGGPHGLCTHATTPRRQKNAIFALKIRVMLKKHAKFSAQVFKTQAVFLQGLMSLQDPRTRGDASKKCIPSSSVHTPSKPRPYSCKVWRPSKTLTSLERIASHQVQCTCRPKKKRAHPLDVSQPSCQAAGACVAPRACDSSIPPDCDSSIPPELVTAPGAALPGACSAPPGACSALLRQPCACSAPSRCLFGSLGPHESFQTTTCHKIMKNKNVKVKSRNSAICSNSKAPRKPRHNLRSSTLP